MIEKYFMLGVRFKWACPASDSSGTKDGSIIDNPLRPSTMTYDGMDGQLYNLAGPHVSTVGLTMRMNIPHTWLLYKLGHTTKLSAPGDILTGPMSGCLITLWTDQGRRYVGHVGTVESSAAVNKKVKSAFNAVMPRNTIGFNPAEAWTPGEISPLMMKLKPCPSMKIMALVTSANRFYAILMFALTAGLPNEWCVGGIKEIQPMSYEAIRAKLTT